MVNRNASKTIAGFNYQQMVGLIVFFKNIQHATEVNIEGEDDIDLLFDDGTISFYQVKESSDPAASGLSKFKQGLKTLDDDMEKTDSIKYLVYVSNSYYPLGRTVDDAKFSRDYGLYKCEDFHPKIRKKITDQQKNHKSINQHFRIMRVAYEGDDIETKEAVYRECIDEFSKKANLKYKEYFRERMKNIAQDIASDDKKKLTKCDLCSTAELCEIIQNKDKNLSDFSKYCNINPGNINSISANYEKLLDSQFLDFEIISKIMNSFNDFYEESTLYGDEVCSDFINKCVKDVEKSIYSDDFYFKEDICKLLMWDVVHSIGKRKSIREAANYHEN